MESKSEEIRAEAPNLVVDAAGQIHTALGGFNMVEKLLILAKDTEDTDEHFALTDAIFAAMKFPLAVLQNALGNLSEAYPKNANLKEWAAERGNLEED
jgi:sialic acid synthase SpsE